MSSTTLQVLPVVLKGLQDKDDDVKAVAADSLLPIVEQTVKLHSDVVCVRSLWLRYLSRNNSLA